jgi:LmbE family N-acetylglucosaminyl deacetylase
MKLRSARHRYGLRSVPRTGDWLREAPEEAGPQDRTEPVPRHRSARFAAVLLVFFCGFLGSGGKSAAAVVPAPNFAPTDRILVLAPHPDDEVLGAGGAVQRAIARGLPVEVAFLTYGDLNEGSFLTYRLHPVVEPSAVRAMGEMRRQEALAAGKILGIPAGQLTFLGYPDGGTLDLWTSHWGVRPPGHGRLTRSRAVPYPTALRPGAAYRGEEVLADLTAILTRFRPTQIFVSHPADRHPDHASLYLFTQVALWDLAGKVSAELHPYLVHFPHWPEKGYRPTEPATPPASLEAATWRSSDLTPSQVEIKHRALAAHRTQWRSGERHLLPFVRATEITEELPASDPAVRRNGERVEISLALLGDRPKGVGKSLFVFGYRAGSPFAALPKLELRFLANRSGAVSGCTVLDQGKPLPGRPVNVERRADRLVLSLPGTLLGDPDHLLVGARAPRERSALPDLLPWRAVSLAP